MTLKTFNIDEGIYKKYSSWCKKNGISMSRRVENFLRSEVEGLHADGEKNENKKKAEKSEAGHPDNKHEIAVDKTHHREHPLQKYC